jgi:uncharacterized protein YaaN involved in tellurite resistance
MSRRYRARQDATDRTAAHATEIRARQEVRSVKEIATALTEVLAVVDSLSDARAQEFMKKYVGPSLMTLVEHVEDYKQASADVTTGIIREAYPVGIERPPTLLDFFFPPKD